MEQEEEEEEEEEEEGEKIALECAAARKLFTPRSLFECARVLCVLCVCECGGRGRERKGRGERERERERERRKREREGTEKGMERDRERVMTDRQTDRQTAMCVRVCMCVRAFGPLLHSFVLTLQPVLGVSHVGMRTRTRRGVRGQSRESQQGERPCNWTVEERRDTSRGNWRRRHSTAAPSGLQWTQRVKRFSHWVTRGHFLTWVSKFNFLLNGGIFDVSPQNDRASPKVKTP